MTGQGGTLRGDLVLRPNVLKGVTIICRAGGDLAIGVVAAAGHRDLLSFAEREHSL
jgi:hypothetical protein